MNTEQGHGHQPDEGESTDERSTEKPDESGSMEVKFKVTVRKLEIPVRPRGVLAE